jgi:DNA-binding LacI/PurR family transcriptional regulator
MDRRGLPVVGDVIVPGPPTVEGGYDAASGLLTQHPETTAVFAYNDLMALGTAHLCADRGCPVPGGCAVIGFDDIRMSSMASPSLTTIYVDKYEVGRQSMTRLLAMFDDTMSSFPPIEIDVDLVVRESAP